MVAPPSMAEFLDSPLKLDVVVGLPTEEPSFFETPRLTMPMSLTRTADPDFYYLGFADIYFCAILDGLPPKIPLQANTN